jgi:hypothetical protein
VARWLVEEHRARPREQDACERDPLLFSDGQHLCPVPDLTQPDHQM